LLAGENVGHSFVIPTVASSIDIVVHTATDSQGHRRVREIIAVPGRVEGAGEAAVIEVEDIFVSRGGRLVRADGYPPHIERFQAAGFNVQELLEQARFAEAGV
jgi:pilus assembly protein CpaF